MDEVEAVVVGAGVIGLAAARALALAGKKSSSSKRPTRSGSRPRRATARSSTAGSIIRRDSLKATACVEGRKRLYDYCRRPRRAARGARQADRRDQRGRNPRRREDRGGGPGQRRRQPRMARRSPRRQRMEPELNCVAALLSPSTGIIDSHALMLAYQGEAEDNGAMVAFKTPLLGRQGARRRVRARGRRRRAGDDPLPLSGQRGGAARAGAGPFDRGHPARHHPARLFLPRLLFHPGRQDAVQAADLPGAGAGRARRPHHPRPSGAGAVRPRCRMDRRRRLFGRSAPLRLVLCGGAALLAGAEGRSVAARLCRDPAEDQRPQRPGRRFFAARPGRAWRAGLGQLLRDRVAGIDRVVVRWPTRWSAS